MEIRDEELHNLHAIQSDWQSILGMASIPGLSLVEALNRMPSIARYAAPGDLHPREDASPAAPSSLAMPIGGSVPREEIRSLRATVRESLGLEPDPEVKSPEAVEGVEHPDAHQALEQAMQSVIGDWRNLLLRPAEFEAMGMIMLIILMVAHADLRRDNRLSDSTCRFIVQFMERRTEQSLALADLLGFMVESALRAEDAGQSSDYTTTLRKLLSNVRATGLDQLLV